MVPRRKLGVRIRRHRGELLVAVDDTAFELADSAEFVFTMIDGVCSVADIAHRLASEYGIDEREAYEDASGFISSLVAEDIVELDGAASAARTDIATPGR